MEKLKLEGFKLMGLKLDKKTSNKNGQSAKDCGQLWQKFENENWFQRIPGKLDNDIFAVYFDYEADHTRPFAYFIGCKVDNDSEDVAEMFSLQIPQDNYAMLLAKGKMPDCIANCWKDIWISGIERSYRYDFEIYNERSKDWNNAEVEVFVSVK